MVSADMQVEALSSVIRGFPSSTRVVDSAGNRNAMVVDESKTCVILVRVKRTPAQAVTATADTAEDKVDLTFSSDDEEKPDQSRRDTRKTTDGEMSKDSADVIVRARVRQAQNKV